MSNPILSKSELSQIKRAKVKKSGKKVITDDIKKLKSLSIDISIDDEEKINYYSEPVEIEYYIPKESRFQVDIKKLYIRLIDPLPLNENQELIFNYFKEKNICYDIIKVMNAYPQFLMDILDSYQNKMEIMESLSFHLNAAEKGELLEYKKALYVIETLRNYEPTVCNLEVLGDYITYSLNHIIRVLNKNEIEFSLEDTTISFLIKLHEMDEEARGIEADERFEILRELFYQQAFPHRGRENIEDLLL